MWDEMQRKVVAILSSSTLTTFKIDNFLQVLEKANTVRLIRFDSIRFDSIGSTNLTNESRSRISLTNLSLSRYCSSLRLVKNLVRHRHINCLAAFGK